MRDRLIIIRNWDRFQHKDVWRKSGGRPPWIKDYTAQLHDDDYIGLTCAQRGVLHGLRLMYASMGAKSERGLSEDRARTTLTTSAGEARHFRGHLQALSDAGLIEFLSLPSRDSVARDSRLEEKRVEKKDQRTTTDVTNGSGLVPLDEPYFEPEMLEVLRDI